MSDIPATQILLTAPWDFGIFVFRYTHYFQVLASSVFAGRGGGVNKQRGVNVKLVLNLYEIKFSPTDCKHPIEDNSKRGTSGKKQR